MGAISIGLSRGSNTVQLDRSSLQNVKSSLVCFLPHCYGLPTYPSRHYAIICCGCWIRRKQGIGVRRKTLTLGINFGSSIQDIGLSTFKSAPLPVHCGTMRSCYGFACYDSDFRPFSLAGSNNSQRKQPVTFRCCSG